MPPLINVMLFVEMPTATPWQREQFRGEMAGRDWLLLVDHEDTYCTSYVGPQQDSAIVRASEADAEQAAQAAGLTEWNGVCVLSG